MAELITLFICLFFVYLAVGYTGVLLLEVEDDTIFTIIFTLFWPIIWACIIIFCIAIAFIGTSKYE